MPYCVVCWILVPQPGLVPVPPAVDVWSCNHWTGSPLDGFLLLTILV